MTLAKGSASLTWGEVLGVTGYRLYRRLQGSASWELAYHGLDRAFSDRRPDIVAPFYTPGASANIRYAGPAYPIYEYAVSAVDGNGEGPRCRPIDTDPASWLNWDPMPGEPFRRRFTYNDFPYYENDPTSVYYPR